MTGDGRWETEDTKTGDGRLFSDFISGKFCAFNLASELYKFLKNAIRFDNALSLLSEAEKYYQFSIEFKIYHT